MKLRPYLDNEKKRPLFSTLKISVIPIHNSLMFPYIQDAVFLVNILLRQTYVDRECIKHFVLQISLQGEHRIIPNK